MRIRGCAVGFAGMMLAWLCCLPAVHAFETRHFSEDLQTAAVPYAYYLSMGDGTLSPIEPTDAGDITLSPDTALVFRAQSFSMHLLRCPGAGGATLRGAWWRSESAAFAFGDIGEFTGDDALLFTRQSHGWRVLKSGGRTLKGCLLREVSPAWGELHIQDLVARAGQDPAFLDDMLHKRRQQIRALAANPGDTGVTGGVSAAMLSPRDREAVALLVSRWLRGPVELTTLTRDEPLHPLYPLWEGAFVDSTGWRQTVDRGFLRIRFWPAYGQEVKKTEACATVLLDDAVAGTFCMAGGSATTEPVSPAAPVMPLIHRNGMSIGLPVELRLALDASRNVRVLWNSDGWQSATYARSVWNFRRDGVVAGRPFIAVTGVAAQAETEGPMERRSLAATSLFADGMDLWGNGLAARQTLRSYGELTQWRPLTPRRDETGALPRRRLVFTPIDQETIGQYGLPEAADITVWSPVAAGGEAMPMPFGPGMAQMLSLVATRWDSRPGVCRFSVDGTLYGLPLWNPEEEAHFFSKSDTLPLLKPESGDCRLWLRHSLAELPPDLVTSASTRERLYRLEPGASMAFDVPGPDISGMLELRLLPTVSDTPVHIEYGSGDGLRDISVEAPRWAAGGTARVNIALGPAETWTDIRNASDSVVWIALYLRTPRTTESISDPFALIPPEVVTEMDAIARLATETPVAVTVAELTRRIQGLSVNDPKDAPALFDLLLQRARCFMAVGLYGDARDDLFMASSLGATGPGKLRLWLLTEAYDNLKRYIPVFARQGGVVPISRDLVPLETWRATRSPRPPDGDMLAVLQDENRYDALWSWWRMARDDNPGPEELALLYGRALHFRDWLMAADILHMLRQGSRPSLFLDVLWLRVLAAAQASGQTADYRQNMEAVALSMKLEETWGPSLSSLRATLTRDSTWRSLKGFRGVAAVSTLPRITLEAPQDTLADAVRESLLGNLWLPQHTITMAQNAYRVVDISGAPATDVRLQYRWKLRPLADGGTPHCHVQVRGTPSQKLDLASPDHWLYRGETLSKPIPLGPDSGSLALKMLCDEPQAVAGVQVRLWSSLPIPGITETAALPASPQPGNLLAVYGMQHWNLVERNRPARVNVQGPTVVELSWRSADTASGAATATLVGPHGNRRVVPLPAGAPDTGTSLSLPLPQTGQYTVRIDAQKRVYVVGRYRVPRAVLSGDAVPLQNGLYQAAAPAAGFARIAEKTVITAEPPVRTRDATGSLWGAWFAATDSVEQEVGITSRRDWVTGPLAGWHSCPVDGLCYKTDVSLRLRTQGDPTGALDIRLSYEAPWGTRIKTGWSGFVQQVTGPLSWAHRLTVALEQRIELHPMFWMFPGIRVHYYGFTLPGVTDIDAHTVDSNIYNAYNFTHFKGIMPYINLYLRPVREIMLVSHTSMRSNTSFSLVYPDRIDSGLDMYIGVAGLLINPEAAISYRFADDLRQNAVTRYTAGLWLGYSWWIGNRLRLHCTGGGRYISDIDSYDARAMLGVVWNFGRGVKDEAPYTPLGGTYADTEPPPYRMEVLTDER